MMMTVFSTSSTTGITKKMILITLPMVTIKFSTELDSSFKLVTSSATMRTVMMILKTMETTAANSKLNSSAGGTC